MQEKSVSSPAPWNKTRVASILGVEYPIIQGPLGGLSTQRLTAKVSNFGGLGSFGAHGLSPSAIGDVIAEIRELTTKPFAMNLWVSMEDEGARSSGSHRGDRVECVDESPVMAACSNPCPRKLRRQWLW